MAAPSKEFSDVIAAIEQGRLAAIEEWGETQVDGVDNELDPQFGATALHWACYHNQVPIARYLLQKGADPNHSNAYQSTPLHWACKAKSVALVQLLLQHKADQNLKTSGNDTPLDIAKQVGASAVVELLQRNAQAAALASPSIGDPFSGIPFMSGYGSFRLQSPLSSPSLLRSVAFSPSASVLSPNRQFRGAGVAPSDVLDVTSAIASMASLEKSKIKLELELKNAESSAADLRMTNQALQKEKMRMEVKTKKHFELQKLVDTLQRDKINLEFKVRHLNAELEAKHREMKREFDAAREAELTELNNRIRDLEKDNRKTMGELERIHRLLVDTRELAAQANVAAQAEANMLRETIGALTAEKVVLEVKNRHLGDTSTTVCSLLKEKAAFEVEISTLKEQAVAHELAMQRRAEEVAKFREERKQNDLQVVSLKRELQLFNFKLKAAERKGGVSVSSSFSSGDSALSKLESTLKEAEGIIESNRTELQQAENLQAVLRSVTSERDSVQSELAALQAEMKALRDQNMEQAKVIASQQVDMTQLRTDLTGLIDADPNRPIKGGTEGQPASEKPRSDMAYLQAMVAKLNAQVSGLQSERDRLKVQVDSLTQTRDAHEKLLIEHDALQEQLRHTKKQLDDFTINTETRRAREEASHKSERGVLERKIMELHAELHQTKLDMQGMAHQVVDAQNAVTKATEGNLEMQACHYAVLRQTIETLMKEKAELEANLETAHQNTVMSYTSSEQLLQQRDELEKALVKVREEFAESKEENKALSALASDLQARLGMAEKDFAELHAKISAMQEKHDQDVQRICGMAEDELENTRVTTEQDIQALHARLRLLEEEKQALVVQVQSLQDQVAIRPQQQQRPGFTSGLFALRSPDSLKRLSRLDPLPAASSISNISRLADQTSALSTSGLGGAPVIGPFGGHVGSGGGSRSGSANRRTQQLQQPQPPLPTHHTSSDDLLSELGTPGPGYNPRLPPIRSN